MPSLYLIAIGFLTQYAIAVKTKGEIVALDLRSQVVALMIGLAVTVGLFYIRPSSWQRIALPAHLVATVLLGGVLLFGEVINGAARWLSISGFQFQPSEVAKITLIVVLSRVLGKQRNLLRRDLLVSFVLAAVPSALVAAQPDLGSAAVFLVIWLVMVGSSNLSMRTVVAIFIGVLIVAASVFPLLHDYQRQRILSFVNPSLDASGANYNAIQASIAIGNGGITGNGLDAGSQSQLNFLPSQNTDFIFAVVAEKLGLLGAGSIIIALAILTLRLLQIAVRTEEQFSRLIVVGITSLVFFHAFVNIGMNLGLAPVTGVPLPFVSYGGSFLTVMVILIGMAMAVYSRQQVGARSQR